MLNLSVYDRRKKFNPVQTTRGLKYKLYARLCKVEYVEGKRVYDSLLNLSYELKTDIGNTLYYGGEFESDEIDFIVKKELSQVNAPVILDIGANIGLHSLAFAKAKSDVQIYAFEPSPQTRNILEYNVRASGLHQQISVFPQAISDRMGKASFFQTDDNAYSSLKDTKRKAVNNTVEVDLITLDNFVALHKFTKLDLVKIDVEGFDNEVISGGLASFKKFRPAIFIEIYKGTNSNPDPELTIRTLLDIGYKAFVLVDGNPVPYQQHSDQLYNYYFTMH